MVKMDGVSTEIMRQKNRASLFIIHKQEGISDEKKIA
jgi:hypothetical protein